MALHPTKRRQFRSLYNFGANFIYANSDVSRKNYVACDKMAIYLVTCSIRVNLLVLLSYLMAVCVPFTKTLFTDENEMILPVILPFIDPDTENGFIINYTDQVITCIFGSCVIPGTELLTCVLKNNVTAAATAIEISIIELKMRMIMNTDQTIEFVEELRNIIMKILDYDRYVVGFIDVLYWKHLVQPLILVYAIAVSIFSYMMVSVLFFFFFFKCKDLLYIIWKPFTSFCI